MTIDDMKKLKKGDRVIWSSPPDPAVAGTVTGKFRCHGGGIVVDWDDGYEDCAVPYYKSCSLKRFAL